MGSPSEDGRGVSARSFPTQPGDRFGRLVVVIDHGSQNVSCQCDCGQVAIAVRNRLRRGETKSCGCLHREHLQLIGTRSTRHGQTRTREYIAWCSMNRRCNNPHDHAYARYGAVGISVHSDWAGNDGFSNFLHEIGPCPSTKHTLDRIDGTKGYEPGNVRWATPTEQARNRKSNVMVTAFGRSQCLAAWSQETGIKTANIWYRIHNGWPPEDAVTKPPRPIQQRK